MQVGCFVLDKLPISVNELISKDVLEGAIKEIFMFYIRLFKIFLSKWLEPVLSHVFWFSFQFIQVGFLAMPLKISAFLSDMKERSCSQKP